MKRLFVLALLSLAFVTARATELPKTIYVGGQTSGHVQGIAYDAKNKCLYLSFTTRFLKADLEGNVIASIEHFQGHLGAMTLSPVDGKVYASYECKDDEIGKGISNSQGTVKYTRDQVNFRIAVIDVEKLTAVGMEPDELVKTFNCVPALNDYLDGKYGCSGIDGITFVPRRGLHIGKKSRWQLCVGYGIYSDVSRKDNDCQILLTYDIPLYERYLRSYSDAGQTGPEVPSGRYYIYTGNTSYGVQNMAYDAATGKLFIAVYKGRKQEFKNYSLFATDWKPSRLSTSYEAAVSGNEPLDGWMFKWGSTGLYSFGDGLWYISEQAYDKATKTQSCTARLYRYDSETPFVAE